MDDVKKTWCVPAWLLDPERLERQLYRSAKRLRRLRQARLIEE